MPRKCNPDLSVDWKICLPATLAGTIENRLFNLVTGKPRYGERSKLICWLLADWLEKTHQVKVEVEPPAEDLIKPRQN